MERRHTLSNGNLRVTIQPKGAELTSIQRAGTEYLWQAGAEWPRHAPVLFPIVGKLKDDAYTFGGRSYRLPQHGFARDRIFTVIEVTDTFAEFELKADTETRENYPFDFVLRIAYTLKDHTVVVKYTVANPGNQDLYFSIGAHPGFMCPIGKDDRFDDYTLLFNRYSLLQTVLEDGLRSENRKLLPLEEKTLPLTSALFDNDALVFDNGQVSEVTLRSVRGGNGVRMVAEGWPYFGIWTKKATEKFICLEPWHGVADPVGGSKRLEEKEGIRRLAGGGSFTCGYEMTFF